MVQDANQLDRRISDELALPVHGAVEAMCTALREEFGDAVAAILFYGSCLRESDFRNKIADFYVLVDDYRSVHRSGVMAILNRLFPPNVYFRSIDTDGQTVRAKVAVLSLKAFENGAASTSLLASIWGRFCQPCRLPYARDDVARQRVIDAVAQAARTFASRTAPLLAPDCTSGDFWIRGLSESYRTELRSEKSDRITVLYDNNRAYFDAIFESLERPRDTGRRRAEYSWFISRLLGKSYSVVRLIKAAFTFDGGAEYICWKIARHSGVEITLTPWQRRHPILASTVLFWDLYRKGAFR